MLLLLRMRCKLTLTAYLLDLRAILQHSVEY